MNKGSYSTSSKSESNSDEGLYLPMSPSPSQPTQDKLYLTMSPKTCEEPKDNKVIGQKTRAITSGSNTYPGRVKSSVTDDSEEKQGFYEDIEVFEDMNCDDKCSKRKDSPPKLPRKEKRYRSDNSDLFSGDYMSVPRNTCLKCVSKWENLRNLVKWVERCQLAHIYRDEAPHLEAPNIEGLGLRNVEEKFSSMRTRDKEQLWLLKEIHDMYEKTIADTKKSKISIEETQKLSALADTRRKEIGRDHTQLDDVGTAFTELWAMHTVLQELLRKQKKGWFGKKVKSPKEPDFKDSKVNCRCHEKISHLENKIDEQEKNLTIKDDINRKLNDKYSQLESKISRLNDERDSVVADKNKDIERLIAERDAALTDKEAALTRLSEVASDKLRIDNPAITDLSDENRPLTLAEKFSELYDNEWSDLYDELCDSGHTEREVIDKLLRIVKSVYDYCCRAKDLQEENLLQNFGIKENFLTEVKSNENRGELKSDTDELKLRKQKIRRFLKSTRSFSLEIVKQKMKAEGLLPDAPAKETVAYRRYFNKCTRICWMMQMQEKPIVLVFDFKHGGTFSTDMFRHYTRTGKCADFLVWPVMLLYEDGPVLQKGVLQPA